MEDFYYPLAKHEEREKYVKVTFLDNGGGKQEPTAIFNFEPVSRGREGPTQKKEGKG